MIKFSNVSLIYPNSTTTVIEDLTLEISEGELVLVIGPTGSGKTTTLHSVLRYINTPDKKIWTAEDPVEITQYRLPGSGETIYRLHLCRGDAGLPAGRSRRHNDR